MTEHTAPTPLPLSLLDLALVRDGAPMGEAFAESVEQARVAEAAGFRRVWYAEHHNMPSIASSATAVLIAHVAAHTDSIRLCTPAASTWAWVAPPAPTSGRCRRCAGIRRRPSASRRTCSSCRATSPARA